MAERDTHITVYEPNSLVRAGVRIWRNMFRELFNSRELVWRLILRDVSARYRQSTLGVLWAFLTPLALMLVFVWVRSQKIVYIRNTTMPYAAFVFMGQMIWLLFSQGVTTASQSLVEAGAMVTKINFPRETLVLSKLGHTVFEFILRIPLLFIVFLWTGFTPEPTIVLVPFVLIPLLFMVAGIGFFVALMNAVLRDIGSILMIVMTMGMFATPVIYPPPVSWPMSFIINYLNPVSGILTAARDLASVGHLTDPASFVTASIFGLLVFLMGWRAFHLVEPKLAEGV